jgi:hypothetical protein
MLSEESINAFNFQQTLKLDLARILQESFAFNLWFVVLIGYKMFLIVNSVISQQEDEYFSLKEFI